MLVSGRSLRNAAVAVFGAGALLLGGAGIAGAEPEPAVPPPNCTAGDLAVASGTVGTAMGDYLFSHPDVNDFFTSLRVCPTRRSTTAFRPTWTPTRRPRPRSTESVSR